MRPCVRRLQVRRRGQARTQAAKPDVQAGRGRLVRPICTAPRPEDLTPSRPDCYLQEGRVFAELRGSKSEGALDLRARWYRGCLPTRVQAYQAVAPLNASPTTIRNLSYSPAYVGRPITLKAKRPTAALTLIQRSLCPVNGTDTTTMTIGISIRTAIPNHAAASICWDNPPS